MIKKVTEQGALIKNLEDKDLQQDALIKNLEDKDLQHGALVKNLEDKDPQHGALVKNLEDKDLQHGALVKNLEDKDLQKDSHIKSLKAEMDEMKSQFAVLDAQLAAIDNVRLTMFVANLLLEAIKKLAKIRGEQFPKGNNDPEHSTNRYQQYAEKLRYDDRGRAAWKKDTGLDPLFLTMVRNLKNHQIQRNDAAHETQYQFARLLLSNRYRNEDEHRLYGELFEWVYGMTVEVAAKVEQNPTPFAPNEIGAVKAYLKKKVAFSAGKEESGNP